MIELAPHTAVMAYLALIFTGLTAVWATHYLFQRKKPSVPPPRQLTVCEYCHMSFLRESSRAVCKCPQCGSYLTSKKG